MLNKYILKKLIFRGLCSVDKWHKIHSKAKYKNLLFLNKSLYFLLADKWQTVVFTRVHPHRTSGRTEIKTNKQKKKHTEVLENWQTGQIVEDDKLCVTVSAGFYLFYKLESILKKNA